MIFPRLLAKSCRFPEAPCDFELLPGHTVSVVKVAMAVVDSVGAPALRSLGLADTFSPDDLRSVVLRSAVLHDLGKTSDQFQRMVRRESSFPQALRHEWISAWIPLAVPAFDRWLFSGQKDWVRPAALAAVVGHHLKFSDLEELNARGGSGESRVAVLCDHADAHECLRRVYAVLGTTPPSSLPRLNVDLLDRPLGELRDWVLNEGQAWFSDASPDVRRLLALVKALTVSADAAGSALPRSGINPAEWTSAVLARTCTEVELRGVAEKRLGGKVPRPFQRAVAEGVGRVILVSAGCGSGKTVAAYLWAARHAGGRRVFFCYPTTGTATEGYRGYIVPDGEIEAALLHSRSEVDLADLVCVPEEDPVDVARRIETLATWDVPFVMCTTDQVLGVVQNYYSVLCASPSLANAAFVFDEIHQYDDRMFGALLRFLEAFRGAPMLLMTASLQQSRLEAIRGFLEKMTGENVMVVAGPPDWEAVKRYRMEGIDDAPPWDRVKEALSAGGRVLWVANTVKRCCGFAIEAKKAGIAPVLIYHSRFRYCDRLRKHQAVVEAFDEKRNGPVLAITTQVCEVSLDLSADLLVTDLAPVPSLIQRMGRLNRRASPESPAPLGPVIFLDPQSGRPYEDAELIEARQWIGALGGGPLAQADLASAHAKLEAADADVPGESAWLDGGPFSHPAPLREAEASIGVIRGEDRAACVDASGRPIPAEIVRRTIPMLLGPVAKEIGGLERLGSAFVVPPGRIEYSEDLGAKWASA